MLNVNIDGKPIEVETGTTILEAADKAGINIPTLCKHEDLAPLGTCGMCMVEIDGKPDYARACITEAQKGMQIRTHTRELRRIKRRLLQLVLAAHPDDCLQCIRHGECELQKLAEKFEIRDLEYDQYTRGLPIDSSAAGIVRDMNKCIGCGRCVEVCQNLQTVKAISFFGRGANTIVSPGAETNMGSGVCVNCGQCVVYCPVGALHEREQVDHVWAAIENPELHVATQIAPAVRVALGEEFGMAPGELVIDKIYHALKMLGIDTVFDTNFSADLTIMEEGTEFLNRLSNGGPFPLITSCSPGWIKFGETYFPDLIDNISSCKSPQQMMGSLIKTYFSETRGIPPEKIVSLSIMPCTAKKFEADRPEMNDSGFKDVDYVLTTRELARMIRQAGINFDKLEGTTSDSLLSAYSGAGTIFGATGGVMEAALRTAYELHTGKPLENINLKPVRGMEETKTATIPIEGEELRVAVVHGLSNARELLSYVQNEQQAGRVPYHFIEVMACRGGCVGGGGQPIENSLYQRNLRGQGLYKEDAGLPVRKSHENPEIAALYEHYLDKPGGERSHHLLHTRYTRRNAYTL
ncbi:NADH-dependent [FeFe] hydrogenase, group A6 [Marispirochaeta sp.]|uniref:NADH-dependent [FeFe] hydrogenase, group A6 n=1 Tax=Marispirochaeta sp. TaxID=2038653 RepID=UPI0029C94F11|nr:NADH-dependent [FeFe] hydrogenase, group A6 [Marispirochaeta sp.]